MKKLLLLLAAMSVCSLASAASCTYTNVKGATTNVHGNTKVVECIYSSGGKWYNEETTSQYIVEKIYVSIGNFRDSGSWVVKEQTVKCSVGNQSKPYASNGSSTGMTWAKPLNGSIARCQ